MASIDHDTNRKEHEEIKDILNVHRSLIDNNTELLSTHLKKEEEFQEEVINKFDQLAPVQGVLEDAAVLGRWLNRLQKVVTWFLIVGGAIAAFFVATYEYLIHIGKVK